MRSALVGIEDFGIWTHVTVEFVVCCDVVEEISVYVYACAVGWAAF